MRQMLIADWSTFLDPDDINKFSPVNLSEYNSIDEFEGKNRTKIRQNTRLYNSGRFSKRKIRTRNSVGHKQIPSGNFKILPRPGTGGEPPSFWGVVKNKFFFFFFTEHEKYEQLIKDIFKNIEHGKTITVGLVAAYIATHLGVEVGAITGFIAVLLYFLFKLGKETYCTIRSYT